jgi:hypothetical protein
MDINRNIISICVLFIVYANLIIKLQGFLGKMKTYFDLYPFIHFIPLDGNNVTLNKVYNSILNTDTK